MKRTLISAAAAAAAATTVAVTAGSAEAVPVYHERTAVTGYRHMTTRFTTILPGSARWCHAHVRAYLVKEEARGIRIVRNYGRNRIDFRDCADGGGTPYIEYVVVPFRVPGPGRYRIGIEAWTPLQDGRVSRHWRLGGPRSFG